MSTKSLTKLTKVIEVLKTVYAELPIQQISVFLAVASEEGITMPELATQLAMPQGSLSRNVKRLAVFLEDSPDTPNLKVKAGYDLIETRQDLVNRKSLALYLTPRGREIRDQIESIMTGGK